MKYLYTIAFLLWEGWLRVRGAWRRGDARKLARYALLALSPLILGMFAVALFGG